MMIPKPNRSMKTIRKMIASEPFGGSSWALGDSYSSDSSVIESRYNGRRDEMKKDGERAAHSVLCSLLLANQPCVCTSTSAPCLSTSVEAWQPMIELNRTRPSKAQITFTRFSFVRTAGNVMGETLNCQQAKCWS